jgi:predicted ribosome quality control (RQC) complex YloA/Tae2 family protein
MLPVRKAAEKEYRSADSAIKNIEDGLSKPSRATEYRLWADLLMARQIEPQPNSAVLPIPSFEDPNLSINVPVKAGLNRAKLAEHYYNKARSAEKRRSLDGSRLVELKENREHYRQIIEELDVVDNAKSWAEFEKINEDSIGHLLGRKMGVSEEPGFRKYVLPDGYYVYVGKNATQNDRLTTKFARKDDFWLHARGVPGSHVVLRVKGRESPPPSILEKAAQIAAFHSKSRTSSLAPVIVVRKKYVRKPKGAQKGAVVVDREEVLLVEPRIPNN